MAKKVVLAGALDTKGAEYAFVKALIEEEGLETLVVDFGVMGSPAFSPDIPRAEVMAAGGGDLTRLASGDHKDHKGPISRNKKGVRQYERTPFLIHRVCVLPLQ